MWDSFNSIAIVVGDCLWIHGGELTTWDCTGRGFGSAESAAGDVSTLPSMFIKG